MFAFRDKEEKKKEKKMQIIKRNCLLYTKLDKRKPNADDEHFHFQGMSKANVGQTQYILPCG